MKRIIVLLALLGLVSACTSGPYPAAPPVPKGYRPIGSEASFEYGAKALIKCNHDNAARFAHQQGDPLSLGSAAFGMCGSEASYLREVLMVMHGPDSAMRIMQNFERSEIQSNAAIIVRMRG